MKSIISAVSKACCLSFLCTAIFSGAGINSANAHCKGKHADYEPHCGGTEPPPDPDPGGSADPQVVYRGDGGIYLANSDGTSQTLIRSDAVPKLDTSDPNSPRVLFNGPDSTGSKIIGMLPYSLDSGNIVVGTEKVLITEAEIGGKLSSEGVSDWSPDGSKYSYSYWTGTGEQAVYRMMVAPDPILEPNGIHSVAYESEPNGGLNSATWDASGDFIYHQDNPLDGSHPNGLFVIDVSTVPGKTVAVTELGDIFESAGFSRGSNVQSMSASYEIGGDQLILDNTGVYRPGKYSFRPGDANYPATSDTSLCLMLSVIDWSLRRNNRFIVIIDLPKYFDSNAWAGGLSCSIATDGTPILNFEGTDFTIGDAGIVGRDASKNRNTGVWVYSLGTTESRTKIISDGGFPDWSN